MQTLRGRRVNVDIADGKNAGMREIVPCCVSSQCRSVYVSHHGAVLCMSAITVPFCLCQPSRCRSVYVLVDVDTHASTSTLNLCSPAFTTTSSSMQTRGGTLLMHTSHACSPCQSSSYQTHVTLSSCSCD